MKKLIILLLFFHLLAYGEEIRCLLPEGTRFESLVPVGQLKSPYHYRIGANKEPIIVSDGICINLSDANSPIIAFPQSFGMNDVSWMENGDCVFSDSSNLYYRNLECDSILKLVGTRMNCICFKTSNYGIYFYDKDSTDLFFFSYPTATVEKVCRFAQPINDISVSDDVLFVAYGGRVCMISRNKELTQLFKASVPISSLVSRNDGTLFYGTTEGLFYYDNKDRQFQLANGNIKELMIDDDRLYLIFADGSSARLHGISAYYNMAESIKIPQKSVFLSKVIKQDKFNLINARKQLQNSQTCESTVQYYNAIYNQQINRSVGTGVSGDLLAEYSYVLALRHNFEAALMNIDRARMVGTKYGDFYAAQVLTLMGYTDAAQKLMKQAKVPDWISGTYQGLNDKYKTMVSTNRPMVSINRDAPETALKRANKLAANRQTIQAIALFEELSAIYPNTYIIYVDYSTVWESLGNYAYAAHLLQKGIDLMPEESGIENPLQQNKQIFQNHLAKVNQMKASFENASWLKRLLGMNPPKMMTYVGASAAKDFYSLNGRMGVYTSNKFSASLNLGLNYASEEFSGSVGISAYKAWGIFVSGLGVTDMFGKDSNTFSLTPSVGLSFLNKSQTSSFDIMVNGYVPFSSDQKFSYSISVGKTIYFDLKGLLK